MKISIVGPGGRSLLAALATRVVSGIELSIVDDETIKRAEVVIKALNSDLLKDEKFELVKDANNKCTGRKSDRKRNRKNRWR